MVRIAGVAGVFVGCVFARIDYHLDDALFSVLPSKERNARLEPGPEDDLAHAVPEFLREYEPHRSNSATYLMAMSRQLANVSWAGIQTPLSR